MCIYDILYNIHEQMNTTKKRIFYFLDYPTNMLYYMDSYIFKFGLSRNEEKLTNRGLVKNNLALELFVRTLICYIL